MLSFEYFLQPIWFVCRLTCFWNVTLKRIPFYCELLLRIYFVCFLIVYSLCSYYTFLEFDDLEFVNYSPVVKYADSLVTFISIGIFYFCTLYNFLKRHVWLELINRLNLITCARFNIVKERNRIIRRSISLVLCYTFGTVIAGNYFTKYVKHLEYHNLLVYFVVTFLYFSEGLLLECFLKYIKSSLEEVNSHLKKLLLNSSNIEFNLTNLLERYYELMFLFSSVFSLLSFSTILFFIFTFITTTVYVNYTIKSFIGFFYGQKLAITIILTNIVYIIVFFIHNYMNISIVAETKKEVKYKMQFLPLINQYFYRV